MDWITALLAFATTMLFFSVVVSTLVELVHRVLRMREAGLHRMLRNYFETVVEPLLPKGHSWNGATFADKITDNRAVASASGSVGLGVLGTVGEWLSRLIDRFTNASTVSHMPVEVFMEKFAGVGIFDKATFDGPDGPKMLEDLAQKFVAFGSEMSQAFERQARVFSIIIAVIVAICFYVHPYRLALAYLGDSTLAANVTKLHKDLIAKQEELERQKLVGYPAETPAAGGERGSTGDGAGESETAPVAADEESAEEIARRQVLKTIDEIDDTINAIKADVRNFTDLGVPIGWPSEEERGLLRLCGADAKTATDKAVGDSVAAKKGDGTEKRAGLRSDLDSFCLTESGTVRPSPGSWFWLLLGGILIGLGSPFWAKVIHAITPMKDVAGKIGEVLGSNRTDQNALGAAAASSSTSAAVDAYRASAVNRPTRAAGAAVG